MKLPYLRFSVQVTSNFDFGGVVQVYQVWKFQVMAFSYSSLQSSSVPKPKMATKMSPKIATIAKIAYGSCQIFQDIYSVVVVQVYGFLQITFAISILVHITTGICPNPRCPPKFPQIWLSQQKNVISHQSFTQNIDACVVLWGQGIQICHRQTYLRHLSDTRQSRVLQNDYHVADKVYGVQNFNFDISCSCYPFKFLQHSRKNTIILQTFHIRH